MKLRPLVLTSVLVFAIPVIAWATPPGAPTSGVATPPAIAPRVATRAPAAPVAVAATDGANVLHGGARSTVAQWPGVHVFGRPVGAPKLDAAQSLAAQRPIFSFTLEQGHFDGERMHDFLTRYPSTASAGVDFQHAMFDVMGTFPTNPLQAYVYHQGVQVNTEGQPKNALWQAYANSAKSGAPAAARDELFLRAHIQDLKDTMASDTFQQLFPRATVEYQGVVQAYYKTVMWAERQLDTGANPTEVAHKIFSSAVVKAEKTVGTSGGAFTWEGAKDLVRLTPPARRFWSAAAALGARTLHVPLGN